MIRDVALLALFAILGVVIYRLYLHPLAKYPGPWIGRVTDLYLVYHSLKEDRHWILHQLHQKHGKFVRYGPNRISILSTTALRDINSPRTNTIKAEFYSPFKVFFGDEALITLPDKSAHSRLRRVFSQAVSNQAIEKMEEHILKNVETFRQFLLHSNEAKAGVDSKKVPSSEGWSQPHDFGLVPRWLTLDILGSVCFSENLKLVTSEENRWMIPILSDGMKCISVIGYLAWAIRWKLHHLAPRLLANLQRFADCSDRLTQARIEKRNDPKYQDIFTTLLKHRNPETGEAFSTDQLRSNAGVLLIAGSEATAYTMAMALFYLLNYPRTLEKLREEIRSKFASVEDIKLGRELSSCRYLRAVIDEAMRITPAVGFLLPRVVLRGGQIFDGHFFPQGTVVACPHYAMHHHEEWYPNASTFWPERWIADPDTGITEDDVHLTNSAFCAFGNGRTSCVGKVMAYVSDSIAIARIVHSMEMRLVETPAEGKIGSGGYFDLLRKKNEMPTWDRFVAVSEGPWIQFRPRRLVGSLKGNGPNA